MTREDNQPIEPDVTAAQPRFVERMFSGFGHTSERPPRPARRASPLETAYYPLTQTKAGPGAKYRLPTQAAAARVDADSPAIDVMTDLTRVAAVCIRSGATVHEAQRAMIAHGVRALFVLRDDGVVQGIVTATDVLGEKPVLLAQQRAVRHDEVPVREVMTRADLLEAMALEDVLRARVGDIVASLRRSGRQHTLVIDSAPDAASGERTVRGIFSVTQIARQLGVVPHSTQSVARTFAEIEAAIAR